MFYKSKLKRYLFRKNWLMRVKSRVNLTLRQLNKDPFEDIRSIAEQKQLDIKTIFDCGANIGFVTHQFRDKFPKSAIYAFEPNPEVYEVLQNSYKTDKNVKCIMNGIGAESGSLKFNVNKLTGSSSFLQINEMGEKLSSKVKKVIEVDVTSIDHFCSSNNVANVDVLKLDIEGFEINALKGADNMLNKDLKFILTEVNFIAGYEGQPLIEDIIAYLRPKGFVPYNIYGTSETKNKQLIIRDLLFISNKYI